MVLKMEKFMTEVFAKSFELNANKELKQNDRNAFRASVMSDMAENFKVLGLEAVEVAEGIAVEYPNEDLGSLVVIWTPTVKPRDYDLETSVQDFENEKLAKIEKAEKAKAEKEAKMAKQKAEKEFKANKGKVTK